jgi:hypothetical protein
MRYPRSRLSSIGFTGAVVVVIMGACAHRPVVVNKSTCTVSWDAVNDPRVSEYRVKMWPNNAGKTEPQNVGYQVKAGKTQASCHDIGASTAGPWLVSVRACMEKNICSEPAGPIAITIVDR